MECVPPVNIIGASVRRERSLTSECQALGKIPFAAPAKGIILSVVLILLLHLERFADRLFYIFPADFIK